MPRWTSDDIDWSAFDPDRLDPELLKLVKAAALVERNAADYAAYLGNVFGADPAMADFAPAWRDEEIRHGEVLGRYAALADPGFHFAARLERFRDGYRLPLEATVSVRGSPAGELLARCIVETGTSSFYSALRDASGEPLLKEICHRIAGDEFRHYKAFLGQLRAKPRMGLLTRLRVAAGRIVETDDDELAYAWHAANEPADLPYERRRCNAAYAGRAYAIYRQEHCQRASDMVAKAVGLDPGGWLAARMRAFAWRRMRARAAARGNEKGPRLGGGGLLSEPSGPTGSGPPTRAACSWAGRRSWWRRPGRP